MKLRISSGAIRLRLGRTELAELAASGRLEDVLHLPHNSTFGYVLEATDSAGHLHPLCACYRSDILPALSSYLDSGRRSVHCLLDRLDLASVLLDDAALTNINTRADHLTAGADSRRGQV